MDERMELLESLLPQLSELGPALGIVGSSVVAFLILSGRARRFTQPDGSMKRGVPVWRSAVSGDEREGLAALPEGTVESLLKKENRKQLIELLTTHVVSGKVSAGDALNAKAAKSLSGSELEFAINNGLFTVNGSVIRSAGIDGGNGLLNSIHGPIE